MIEMCSFQKFLLIVHVYVCLCKNLHKTANNQKWMLVGRCRRTILDPASWCLSQSCDSYAAAFAVEMRAQMGQITNTAWKNTYGMLPVQLPFNSGILASGKTRRASKPSNTTTAWWPASNLTYVPLFMKCQINNQLKPDLPQHKPGSPWENWSLPTTSSFPFLHCTISI